jgi:hypothetical protein
MVERTYDYLLKLAEKLSNGGVKVCDLRWLLQHEEEFKDVIVQVLGEESMRHVLWSLRLREKELEAFNTVMQDINCALRWLRETVTTGKVFGPFEQQYDLFFFKKTSSGCDGKIRLMKHV